MKKRIFLLLCSVCVLACLFSFSISATELIKSSSDEFGEVTEVEGLTSTSEDKTARVVLKNSDGTYSTFYTYYIYPKLDWRNGMTGASFKSLNDALGTSYGLGSVIRLEFLYDCVYHEIDKGIYENLKEIHFPENSKITQIRRYYSYIEVLEKINIPKSVTGLDQNAFRDCTGLKEVTFDEGCSLKTIKAEAFKGCSSLTEITIPDSVINVETQAFWGCTSLKTIRYGANLQTFASRATSHTTVFYMPASAMKYSDVKMDSNYFGESYTPKGATIFFTGTYDEAAAFKAKSTHIDAWNGTGGLSNANIVEWNPENPDSYYIDDTSWTIVYGYNKCLAFYDAEHIEGEAEYSFEGKKYLSSYNKFVGCSRCKSGIIEEICGPLFATKGYSVCEDEGNGAITYGVFAYAENIAAYEKVTNEKLIYGIFIGKESGKTDGYIVDKKGESLIDGAFMTDYSLDEYDTFSLYNVKLNNLSSEAQKALRLYFCTYIVDGDNVYYIGEIATNKAIAVSYNSILAIQKKEN